MICIICKKKCPMVMCSEHGECPNCEGSTWCCSDCATKECVFGGVSIGQEKQAGAVRWGAGQNAPGV